MIGIVRSGLIWTARADPFDQMKSLCRQTGDLSHHPCNHSDGFRLYQMKMRPDGFTQRFIALTAGGWPAKYLTQPEKAREPGVHVERKMRF